MTTFLIGIPGGATFLLFALLIFGALTALICGYVQKRKQSGKPGAYLVACAGFALVALLLCFGSPKEAELEEDAALDPNTTAHELTLPEIGDRAPTVPGAQELATEGNKTPAAQTDPALPAEQNEAAAPAETAEAAGTEQMQPSAAPETAQPEESQAPAEPEPTAEPEAENAWRIPEDATVAPKPDENGFLKTDDSDEIRAMVDAAEELIDGRELIWNEQIDFMDGSIMRCYRDDSILVITWKEAIDGAAVTFAEVFIADGSQIRRALSHDSFDSDWELASVMADRANAVIAMNGDFYDNRGIGLSVYQREIKRSVATNLDSCFINTAGDLLLSHAGELADDDEVRAYMEENDVLFALSFGPILVEDGEKQTVSYYPVGEFDAHYSRSAIGQKGELHYLLMTMGEEGNNRQRYGVDKEAEIMASKGVDKAYALDGGQTAVIVMQGETVNRVDWAQERTMSDIIYFATAIPEEENEP